MGARRLVVILLGGCLAVAVLVGGTVAGALALRTKVRYGTVADRSRPALTVRAGDRFTLTVPDRGPSVGDSWRAAVEPAGAAEARGSELVLSHPVERILGPAVGGGAGTRHFIFVAVRPGRLTVTVTNCFQGCRDAETRAASTALLWTVTVT
ncbi:protease inhibitor I42 family protein [Micromonospora sp. NPDC049559]|uniref:protease inhibitor I42 family protein n=1 Tax=Micromonospora sp. NPDC049559 TaxID=3155923 RepID=UPI0034484C2C